MEIMLKLSAQDVELIVTMLKAIDPSGFFAGKLLNRIKEQASAQMQSQEVQIVAKKKEQ